MPGEKRAPSSLAEGSIAAGMSEKHGPRHMVHHPALMHLPSWEGCAPAGFVVDFLGVRTRAKYFEKMVPGGADAPRERIVRPPRPAFDEEYFEWIDLIESVSEARERFVMIELGAGYGRWLVRAVAALRLLNPMPFRLVAVEAEPQHFQWLSEHFRDNGIDPADHDLIEAAVNATGEPVKFHVGNPSGWYGQAIATNGTTRRLRRLFVRARMAMGWRGKPVPDQHGETLVVRGVTLDALLRRLPRVDLIDLDVQGAELDVLGAAAPRLNQQVKRVHVGTHGPAIERGLRELFRAHGWQPLNDYPCQTRAATPYGDIEFGDGVQTWVNPRV